MSYYHKLFNTEVVRQLEADPELAVIFYASFPPYDDDTDPLHNHEWTHGTGPGSASTREAKMLAKARAARDQVKAWQNAK